LEPLTQTVAIIIKTTLFRDGRFRFAARGVEHALRFAACGVERAPQFVTLGTNFIGLFVRRRKRISEVVCRSVEDTDLSPHPLDVTTGSDQLCFGLLEFSYASPQRTNFSDQRLRSTKIQGF
jgi:hypothetical protein